jgi:Cu-Zn family superoxide dismutase
MSAHTGDMGNIEVDETGKGHDEYVDTKIKLEGEGSIIGKAVIVHEKADDQVSQPSGNSGARVACGVIQGPK